MSDRFLPDDDNAAIGPSELEACALLDDYWRNTRSPIRAARLARLDERSRSPGSAVRP